MSELVQTMLVKLLSGEHKEPIVINASDFNPEKHAKYEGPAPSPTDGGQGVAGAEATLETMSLEELTLVAIDLGLEPKDTWTAKKLIAEITKKQQTSKT